MAKKRNKVSKLAMGIVLMMMLVFSMTIPAFAEEQPYAKGTESTPADAAITKRLVMPAGTTTPTTTFEFEFEKKSLDGYDGIADKAAMPPVANATVEFTSADVGSESGGIKTINKESEHLFKDVTWDRAGVYIYTVTELTTTFTNSFAEKVTYTEAVYDVAVYVDNKSDGSGVYIAAISATIVAHDESNEGDDIGDKVDPTPGDMTVEVGDYSQMIFTNYYLKNNGGENPNDTVLSVSKEVSGMSANQEKYFPFSVVVSNPATVIDDPQGPATTYKAYVYDGATLVEDLSDYKNTAGANIKPDGNGIDYIVFESGSAITVNLKHGQWLSFIDLPVGSTFNVTESAVADYTASYKLTLKGALAGSESNQSDNESLSIGVRYLSDSSVADSAAFTNAYQTIIPGGISVNNLPYYVLAALTLLALSSYVVFKSRKRARSNA